MVTGNPAGLGALIVLVTWAAWSDVKCRRISNRLVCGGSFAALVLAAAQGWQPVYGAMGGWMIGALLLLPLYALKATSAGDVKLMSMVGAFFGGEGILVAGMYIFVAGGVLALFWIVWRNRSWNPNSADRQPCAHSLPTEEIGLESQGGASESVGRSPARRLPYAVAIALGTGMYLMTLARQSAAPG